MGCMPDAMQALERATLNRFHFSKHRGSCTRYFLIHFENLHQSRNLSMA